MANSRKKPRQVRIGRRSFIIVGGTRPTFRDLYHESLAMSWPKFFLTVASVFTATNFLFAVIYWLGGDVIANTNGGSLAMLFFFSDCLFSF